MCNFLVSQSTEDSDPIYDRPHTNHLCHSDSDGETQRHHQHYTYTNAAIAAATLPHKHHPTQQRGNCDTSPYASVAIVTEPSPGGGHGGRLYSDPAGGTSNYQQSVQGFRGQRTGMYVNYTKFKFVTLEDIG